MSSTLPSTFQATAVRDPQAVALRSLGGGVSISWAEYGARVRALAEGLASVGLRRRDSLGLLLANRPEFNLLDIAAGHLGAVGVSAYASAPPEQLAFVLRDAGARIAVTERALLEPLRAAIDHGAPVDTVVVVDGSGGTLTLDQLAARRVPGFDFEAEWQAVAPGDVAAVVYTSSTTGPPKGVEHTHAGVLTMAHAPVAALGVQPGGRAISYLPNAHLGDRVFGEWLPTLAGLTTTFCPEPARIGEALREVRPTVFMSVPRIWQRLRAAAEAARAGGADPVAALGLDACTAPIVSSAPCPAELIEFFNSIGVPLVDGYATSEFAPITINRPAVNRPGTVGPPAPGVEIKLAADGEVLARGAALMRGYRNRPDATAEALDADGWLHTGDVGALDEDGYLRLIDRKKELIVNDGGKTMSPANIESALKAECPQIAHAVVVGDRRPYNVALIVLDDAVAGADVAAAVERANARLAPPERIRRHLVLDHGWAPGGPLVTPTMKVRRRAVAQRYTAEIESLYAATTAQAAVA